MKKLSSIPILLIHVFLISGYSGTCQSKKEQISLLTSTADSLRIALNLEIEQGMKVRSDFQKKSDSLLSVIDVQLKEHEQITASAKRMINTLQDTISAVKTENMILYDIIDWSSCINLNEIKRYQLGGVLAFSRLITEYENGVPNEEWNGDSWTHDVVLYYVKENGKLKKVNLEDCFKPNTSELLDRINSLAREQYKEYMETGQRECGGSIRFPLTFSDLVLHLENGMDGGPCFEILDVGVWKGNVCGSPPDMICIDRAFLLKFIK